MMDGPAAQARDARNCAGAFLPSPPPHPTPPRQQHGNIEKQFSEKNGNDVTKLEFLQKYGTLDIMRNMTAVAPMSLQMVLPRLAKMVSGRASGETPKPLKNSSIWILCLFSTRS